MKLKRHRMQDQSTSNYPSAKTGDIVRIHKLLVTANDKVCINSNLLAVFEAFQDVEQLMAVTHTSATCTIEDVDRVRRKELEKWYSEKLFKNQLSSFDIEKEFYYTNIFGRVLAVINDGNKTVLQIFDTTEPSLRSTPGIPSDRILTVPDGHEEKEAVIRLIRQKCLYISIVLYDDHAVFAREQIKFWDLVVIFNANVKTNRRRPQFVDIALNSRKDYGKTVRVVHSKSILGAKYQQLEVKFLKDLENEFMTDSGEKFSNESTSEMDTTENHEIGKQNVSGFTEADSEGWIETIVPSTSKLEISPKPNEGNLRKNDEKDKEQKDDTNVTVTADVPTVESEKADPSDVTLVAESVTSALRFLPDDSKEAMSARRTTIDQISNDCVAGELYSIEATVFHMVPYNRPDDVIMVCCRHCQKVTTLARFSASSAADVSLVDDSDISKLPCTRCKKQSLVLRLKLLVHLLDRNDNLFVAELTADSFESLFQVNCTTIRQKECWLRLENCFAQLLEPDSYFNWILRAIKPCDYGLLFDALGVCKISST